MFASSRTERYSVFPPVACLDSLDSVISNNRTKQYPEEAAQTRSLGDPTGLLAATSECAELD